MLAHPRQVGVVLTTAAFVLLSHVYCACGGAAPAVGAAPQAAPLPPCHRHAHGAGQPGKHKSDPADRGGHQSCPHCNPTTVAGDATQKTVNPLTPAPGPWSPASSPAVVHLGCSARPLLVTADLPPPPPCTTLLGLHCALNT